MKKSFIISKYAVTISGSFIRSFQHTITTQDDGLKSDGLMNVMSPV